MTTNNPNSEYSIPKGSLEIPDYKTKSGKSSIRYVCSNDWNFVLKRLSIKFPDKYNSCDKLEPLSKSLLARIFTN